MHMEISVPSRRGGWHLPFWLGACRVLVLIGLTSYQGTEFDENVLGIFWIVEEIAMSPLDWGDLPGHEGILKAGGHCHMASRYESPVDPWRSGGRGQAGRGSTVEKAWTLRIPRSGPVSVSGRDWRELESSWQHQGALWYGSLGGPLRCALQKT